MKKLKEYLSLLLTMMKIGLFTFGGGYAMIALLESEFVEKKGWLDKDEFLDMAAIAESTPGPIAINAATYIGYKNNGILGAILATLGAILATLGICIPSFTIIFAISLFFDAFLTFTYVQYAFRGIQVAVVYLILSAGIRMLGKMKKTAFSLTILILTALTMITLSILSVNFSTIFYILISGVVGIAAYLIKGIKEGKKE